jgi:hypothetical protein
VSAAIPECSPGLCRVSITFQVPFHRAMRSLSVGLPLFYFISNIKYLSPILSPFSFISIVLYYIVSLFARFSLFFIHMLRFHSSLSHTCYKLGSNVCNSDFPPSPLILKKILSPQASFTVLSIVLQCFPLVSLVSTPQVPAQVPQSSSAQLRSVALALASPVSAIQSQSASSLRLSQ